MSNYISIPNVTLLVTLGAAFVVLFATVLKIFRAVSFFEGKTTVVLALCVCIITLSQFIIIPGGLYDVPEVNSATTVPVHRLLLAYFALTVAAAVVLSQVLLLAGRIRPGKGLPAGDPNIDTKEPEHPLSKPKSPGRPKKEEAAEKQAKKTAKTTSKPSRTENEKAPAS